MRTIEDVLKMNGHALWFTSPDQSVEECLALMTEKHVQHLPVVSNGSLVGSVSMSDLFRTIIDDQRDTIYRLDNYVLGIDFGK